MGNRDVFLATVVVCLSGCYVVATPDVVPAPTMAVIPGTGIQVVYGVPGDAFFYDGFYWRYYDGLWWRSTVWNGRWVVIRTVPRAFLDIPKTHPKHRVVRHHPLHEGRPRPTRERPATPPPAPSETRPPPAPHPSRRPPSPAPERSRR